MSDEQPKAVLRLGGNPFIIRQLSTHSRHPEFEEKNKMTPNLEKLWNLTGFKRNEFKDSWNNYFDPIGLILLKDPVCWEYWCTPTNAISFATTGGDGVHFSFLCENETPNDEQAIIMTLPSADTSNIVVGESFKDFLSLGCRIGYFYLDQIEYDPETHIPFLDSHKYTENLSSNEISMLKTIEDEFDLSPWNNHEARLNELKEKYFTQLKYSDEYYETIS